MDLKKQALVGYLLTDFIYTFPGRAHFKESEKFTYQLSNQRNLDIYNLTEKELVGKTAFDLYNITMKDKWPRSFVEEVHACDVAVVETKEAVNLTDKVFLDNKGALVIHSMVKLPVFNQQHEVSGILTLAFDAPDNRYPHKVKRKYERFYKEQEANMRFMAHIHFHDGVNLKLTSREMDCLMSLVKFRTHKAASKDLDISVKTLDNHLSRIKSKCEEQGYTKDLLEVLCSTLSRV